MKTARVLSAALLTAAALFLCVRPALAAPALWLVQSPTSKVYLFGTLHIMRDGVPWRTVALENAIAQSQDLYLEIDDPLNMSNAAKSIVKLGMDRDHRLSSEISKSDVANLDKVAKLYGYPGEAVFEPMRPWLVSMMLTIKPTAGSKYKIAQGVDVQLRQEFIAANKPVRGFETFDSQYQIFAGMPEATQVAMLESSVKSILANTNQVNYLDQMVAAWQSGDDAKLQPYLDMGSPTNGDLRTLLLTNRNKAWADILSQRLKQPGTSFVAVGALHLQGPDGVPALLQKMGYTVTRVDNPDVTPAPSPTPAATLTPSPQPSAKPIPITIKPPAGWTGQKLSLHASTFVGDMLWSKPGVGAIVAGHLEVPGAATLDLASTDAFFHQGLVALAGEKGVTASKTVKICGGKQDGTYSKVVYTSNGTTVKEDIVLAVSDRPYMAQYVRSVKAKDDPAAIASILSLCAP